MGCFLLGGVAFGIQVWTALLKDLDKLGQRSYAWLLGPEERWVSVEPMSHSGAADFSASLTRFIPETC